MYDTSIDFSPAGLSGGGAQLGGLLGRAQGLGRSPLHRAMVLQLLMVPDVEALEQAYSDLIGNPVSSVLQSGLQTAQSGMVSFAEQADRWRDGEARSLDQTVQTWITPRAGFGDFDAQAGDLSTENVAVAAGVDVQVSPDVLVGFGVAATRNELSVDSAVMSATQDAGGAGVYGMARFGRAYLSGASYIGADHANVSRAYGRVAMGDVSLDGTVAGGRVELGYSFPVREVRLTPFVAFEPVGRWQDDATESVPFRGEVESGLAYDSEFTRSLPLIAGTQLDANIKLPNGSMLNAHLRTGYVHEFDTERDLTKTLPRLQQVSFVGGGEYAAGDSGFVRLGAEYRAWENVSIFADFNSQFAGQGSSFGGGGGVQVRW